MNIGADVAITTTTKMTAARQADCIVLSLGLTSELENEDMPLDVPGFHGGDRTSVLLPGAPSRAT